MKKFLFVIFLIKIQITLCAQTNSYPTPNGPVKIADYSPLLILQRNTSSGGFIQGIQTRLQDDSDNWYFGALDTGSWIVSKGDYQGIKLLVTNGGNIGIGTSSPIYRLQVNKTSVAEPALMIGGGYYGGPRIQTYGLDADAHAWMGLGTDMGVGSYEHSLYFPAYSNMGKLSFGSYDGTTYSTKMIILENGNAGIGTTNPQRLLTLRKNVPNGIGAGIFLRNDQYESSNGAETEIIFGNYSENDLPYRYSKIHSIGTGTQGMVDRLSIGIGTSNESYSDYFTIKAGGNVGIGTISPSSKFEVYPNSGSYPSFTRINLDVSTDLFPKVFLGAGLTGGYLGYDEAGNERMVLSSYDPSSHFEFLIGQSEKVRITANGNVLIAKTSQTNTNYKLDVNGKIRAEEVVVNTTGADFVFEENFIIPDLTEIEHFIRENKHLPGIASASEMATNGLNVGEMQTKLLQKMEEMTIYLIQLKKENEYLSKEINKLKNMNDLK